MSTQSQSKTEIHLDAVIVGAGFSDIASLYRFRKAGLKVKAFEAGSNFGYWNCYPGARVDSEFPPYQLNILGVHDNWEWDYKYLAQNEIAEYFDHMKFLITNNRRFIRKERNAVIRLSVCLRLVGQPLQCKVV